MRFSTQELVSEFQHIVLASAGEHGYFERTDSPDTAGPTSLIFLQKAEDLPDQVAVVVTSERVALQVAPVTRALVVSVDDVRLAQALMKRRFDPYLSADTEWEAIHPSAVIHASAKVASGCRIGPNAVIGADCELDENVIIRANAVIEHDVRIGRDSVVHTGVNIGYKSQIGERVNIQAGAIIGGEGYGFVPNKEGSYQPVPHTGYVRLHDDVHVGSNTCIDRGTYGVTEIGAGVKIDNLVHVAHNVQVGENTLLTAQTGVAGSSRIGRHVITSGQVGILDHKTVPDHTILLHRAGVTEDIPTGGKYAGTPAQPLKEYVRTITLAKKVAKLEQKLRKLQAQLDAPD
ncbi:UDP-3-O-(3-hydroxymyristoyl)glucosamine N-acyltransferase [Arenicella chitinivorans]|nr:UDP-3-O-(3-hydroxymyristoyl)glucosamine N-acyltransferase [Arenicella chitinivorans]